MKKFKLLLTLLLVIMLSVSLFSCGGDEVCEHADENGDNICDKCEETLTGDVGGEDGDGEITLIDNGAFKFQIVQGYDLPVAGKMYLDKLVNMLEDDFGIELKVVEDKASTEEEYEVFLGTVTSRGDKYSYDKHQLGVEGYTIHAEDKKIIVSAGSDDLMVSTIKKFFEDILGIDADAETIGTVKFTEADEIHKPQDNYRVKDVTVDGESVRGYKIVIDTSNTKFGTVFKSAADQLQDFLYTQVGIYLDVVLSSDYEGGENAIIFRGVDKGKAGLNGFRVKLDKKNVYIECAHHNVFKDAFDSYYNKTLAFARGESLAIKNYDSDENLTIVKYSQFGAVGDGKTDDYKAIKATHDFANDGGQTVYGDPGFTYYLNDIPASIGIKTDVNFNGAKFIIDDSNVTVSNNTASNLSIVKDLVITQGALFVLEQDSPDMKATAAQVAAVNALKGDGDYALIGLESSTGETTDNIGFSVGYPALITIYNSKHKNYLRYGYVDTSGSSQHEIVLVDAEGNIDPSTPLLHDFKEVTSLTIHRADTAPITIENGVFEHIASRINLLGGYYSIGRSFEITRANVTIKDLEHIITGEIAKNQPVRNGADGLAEVADGYTYKNGKIYDSKNKVYNGDDIKPFTGHSYGGFVTVRYTHNTLVENVIFQARVYYEEGTYDISAGNSNKLIFKNCDQSNFFEADGKTVNMSKCWGVSGTNYCKNMEYLNCNLTRYDAHSGVTNGKIIGGTLAVLRLIGGGDFLMEGVTVYARNTGAPFQLRSDYGASFNGTLTIKDCNIVGQINSLISAPASYWDMGYKTFMPNIVLDDLRLDTMPKNNKLYLIADISSGSIAYASGKLYPGYDYLRNKGNHQFCYTTRTPDAWVEENITAADARFHGCKYEVKDNGNGTSTVVITGATNPYFYNAPDFIEVKNMAGKGFSVVLYESKFFNDTTVTGDGGLIREPLP